MNFDKEGTITTVSQEKTSLSQFLDNLNDAYDRIKADHLIIDVLNFSDLKSEDLLEFLEVAKKHRAQGKSFVMVSNSIDYDEVPEHLNVAPTLQEAKDIIDLEEIERDLDLF